MLPAAFIARIQEIVPPDKYSEIIKTFSLDSRVSFRINTLKSNKVEVQTALAQAQIKISPVAWYEEAFTLQPQDKSRLMQTPLYQEGKIYLQNLSSMWPVLILDPQPGEEILDLTAAPGSKTTQIATLMHNQGRIAAVEKVKNRYFKLNQVLATQGVQIVETYHKDGRLIWRHCKERFDRVLLDAPCSSEARFNTHQPESYEFWNEKKILEMARNQWALINSALLSLKPGGIMVYSTCSFAPEENEAHMARLIKKWGDKITIEPITLPIQNIQTGLTTWREKKYPSEVKNSIRILPTENMSGFFICRIKKAEK